MTLEEMQRIAEARTPGKWTYGSGFAFGPQTATLTNVFANARIFKAHGSKAKENAEFVAMAANSFDEMLHAVGACKYISDNLATWFLDPQGSSKLKEAFGIFEAHIRELEGK